MEAFTGNFAALFLLQLSQFRQQLLLQALHLVLVSLHARDISLEHVVRLRVTKFLLDLVDQGAHHLRVFGLFLLMSVNALWGWWSLVFGGVAGKLHDGLEDELLGSGRGVFVLLERIEELVDARE